MNYDDGQFVLQIVSSSNGITSSSSSKTLPPLSRPTAAVDGDGDGDYERQLEDHLPGRPAVISVAAVLVLGRYFWVSNFCFGSAALVHVLLLFKVPESVVLLQEFVEGWMQGVVLIFLVVVVVVFILLLFIIVINVEALKSSAFWSSESRRGAKDFCTVNSLRC